VTGNCVWMSCPDKTIFSYAPRKETFITECNCLVGQLLAPLKRVVETTNLVTIYFHEQHLMLNSLQTALKSE